MSSKIPMIGAVLALALTWSATSHAQSDTSAYQGVAVQKRKFQMGNELRLAVGTLPVDPYQKGFSGSLSFTRHLNDYWAWEIFQVTGILLTSTDLRDELIDVFAREPNEFAAPRFMATTGFELTPLYGKWAFLNDSIVHNSLILGAYGGVIWGDRGDISETLTDIRPSFGPGLGYRIFLSRAWSARVDWRTFASVRPEVVDSDDFGVDLVMLITLSMSWNFGVDQ